jgi:hypothetical protein
MPQTAHAGRSDENPSTPGPIDHLVQVQCDPVSHLVTITRPSLTIRPGDRVIWSFSGIPEGWSPWIQIRRDTPGLSFLGPFVALSQSAGGVWGECRPDQETAQFSYRALIQKGVGQSWDSETSMQSSRAAQIQVAPAGTGNHHVFDVTVSADGAASQLAVTPPLVTLLPGDTVEWKFEGIPGEPGSWRPRIDFLRYSGSGTVPNLLLGPFNSLTYGTDGARGMGNNEVGGTYHFEVTLVSASSGEVLWFSSGDPAVDNRGTVGDPSSGTP